MSDAKRLSELERIDHAAAEWLIRRDAGLSAAEQDEFFSWLAADPRHGERFAQHQRTWKEFNLLAQWRPEHSAEPNPDLLARKRSPRIWLRWAIPLATAAVLVIGLFLAQPPHATPLSSARAPERSHAPAYQQRVLEDGSTLELREDSEVRVDFSPDVRRVVLVRGEAYFTVAKNPARPFVVRARDVDVRAVGTSFNVRLDPERVEVLVTEGRVQVTPPVAAMEREIPLLEAGHCAVVPLDVTVAPRIALLDEQQIARVLAWQPRLLDFSETPLGEVVKAFNARNRIQLVIADPDLAGMRVVVSIRSDNVEGFVRLLETTNSVRAERSGDTIALRSVR